LYEDVVRDKVNFVVAKRAVLLEDLREILTTADGTVVRSDPTTSSETLFESTDLASATQAPQKTQARVET
jgi:hypothetical protein